LKEFLSLNHAHVILAEKFPWNDIERDLSKHYSHSGRQTKPIRLMVGLLLLKQMYNLGDETLMPVWVLYPYFQYFCGESEFQWSFPCDQSDLVHFRKRIGNDGVEKIFSGSVSINLAKLFPLNKTII
jgi:transposase, IS5 family